MLRFLRPFTLSSLIVVATTLSALDQVHNTLATDANTKADSPARSGQAPDDVTNKITVLVHAGKYTEAQQLTTGLLAAYPNDQRLIKAKALIEKLLAPTGSANAPSSNQPANNLAPAQAATNTKAEPLVGMEKVDYN